MSNKSGIAENVINLPTGGGAISGLGEKFSPDLFTGTGNFSVPIAVPPGRNGMQPSLTLGYSTGQGNGPFGLGWSLSVPGVMRQTSKGIPIYDDEKDIFVLSGAEDLIPVPGADAGAQRYRPRTEGLFAEIDHYRDVDNDYWMVRTREGLTSWYGTPESAGNDPAVVSDPSKPSKVFGWKLSKTEDVFGNVILYEYERDAVNVDGPHHWDQLYLKRIKYMDYDDSGTTRYLCSVVFEYQDRPDPFSTYSSGFEIRTVRRCDKIKLYTHPDLTDVLGKVYDLEYLDERVENLEKPASDLPLNGVSLLSRVWVEGHDEAQSLTEEMPPLDFNYTVFNPLGRKFDEVTGDLPAVSLAHPDYEVVDLFGNGLPDIVQLNGVARYWRNLGENKYDLPRNFKDAPAGIQLADPNVQIMDADGDGKPDLFVRSGNQAGYFPLRYDGEWDRKSYQRHSHFPSFSFADPEVLMMDLDGDGMTDVLRNGQRLECYFNDKEKGFHRMKTVNKAQLDAFPNVSFSDPRIRVASLSGGMSDIVMVHNGRIDYWPNLGHANFGQRVAMRNCPRFPDRYDPARVMLGDLDGDGYTDLIYVENNQVTLWINQSGNGWSNPIIIKGTPQVTNMDAVRIMDLNGDGVPGLLWTRDLATGARQQMLYLSFTGGLKPYLLHEMVNNMGAVTRVEYASSVKYYLRDYRNPQTRWKTPLPFPVLVVARTEVIDQLSEGKFSTEYDYHHGYWDGAEREFRGFGRVDQRDTESFERYHDAGLFPGQAFNSVEPVHFSQPTETRNWFHLGPVGDEFGGWEEADFSHEYWQEDPNVLRRPAEMKEMLKTLPRRDRRDALRTLRGSVLRSELYALDNSARQDRPYSVSESISGVGRVLMLDNNGTISSEISYDGTIAGAGEVVDLGQYNIFYPHGISSRSSAWERGDEVLTSLSFTADYDDWGIPHKQIGLAVPRTRMHNWQDADSGATEPFLATYSVGETVNKVDSTHYFIGKPTQSWSYEIDNDGTTSVWDLVADVMNGNWLTLNLIAHQRTYYDGNAFTGLGIGLLGDYGVPVRGEALVLTTAILDLAYGTNVPAYLESASPTWLTEYPSAFQTYVNGLSSGNNIVGYLKESAGGTDYNYYVQSRSKFDFQDGTLPNLGLPVAQMDPHGNVSTIEYDEYNLLPVKATDAIGNEVSADYDYRVMAPWQVTDPNGNRSQVEFSPLGLPIKTAVMGKSTETVGDTLATPGSSFEYDFFAFMYYGDPVWVKTTVREYHVNDPVNGSNNDTIQTKEYSDGFGRLLQTRVQAAEVIFGDQIFGDSGLNVSQGGTSTDAVGVENTSTSAPNVVVNGWTTYNNKGAVIESWEPYFDTGWDFVLPTQAQTGQKVTQFYDSLGRAVRVVNPDGTEQRVITGVPGTSYSSPTLSSLNEFLPTPWEQYTYDANDLAPITHPGGGHHVPGTHYYTPRSVKIDALGRTIETTDRNDATGDVVMQYFFDIRGNRVEVFDAIKLAYPSAGRASAFMHVYDLANNPLKTVHIDGGTKTLVLDGAGLPLESRDEKEALVCNSYDDLLRPLSMWARDNSSETATMRQHIVYGDSLTTPEATNHRGQVSKHYDEAGMTEFGEYDFKGNLLWKKRRVIKDSEILGVFDPPPTNWAVQAYRVDWTGLNETALLESDIYETSMTYDGLSRPISVELPLDLDSERKVVEPTYNRSGAMESISLDGDIYVSRIAYNAKGQRVLMAIGDPANFSNDGGIMTRYAYDPVNFRLMRQRSERFEIPSGFPLTYEAQSGSTRQDCEYTFDLSGNIVGMSDESPNAGFNGAATLDREFKYDALYRLLEATGREASNYAQGSDPWVDYAPDTSHANSRKYTRTYTYDMLGNMLKLNHSPVGGPSFNRWFNDYDTTLLPSYLTSNLATKVKYGSWTITNSFDANGNMVSEGSSRHFEWDFADRMRVYRTQTGTSIPSEYAHYLYDAGGNRVKKIVWKQDGSSVVSVYIDGGFEHLYRRSSGGTKSEEHNEVMVMDGRSRIASRRVGTAFGTDSSPAVRYNLEDHLGNASFTLDYLGSLTNREEYFPFGETSFGSYTKKRYRFCGKERDEESGLYYYGARYYMPWQCRFVSVDPLAAEYPFYTPYQYAGNQPIIAIDLDGLEPSGGGQENTKEVVTSRTENTDEQSNTRTIVEKGFSYRFEGDEIVIHAFSTYETYSGDSLVASGRTESEEARGNPEDLNDDVKERIQQNESDLDERLIREPIQGIAKGIAAERNVPNRYRLESPGSRGHGNTGSEAGVFDNKAGKTRPSGKKAGDYAVRWDLDKKGNPPRPHRNIGKDIARKLGHTGPPQTWPHTTQSKLSVKRWGLAAKTLRGASRVAVPIGVIIDALTIANGVIKDGGKWGKNTSKAVGSAAGGWIGAIAGSYLGGIAGTYLGGIIGGPVGAAIGGALGSIFGAIGGSIIGSWLGGEAGEAIYEATKNGTSPARTGSGNPILMDF